MRYSHTPIAEARAEANAVLARAALAALTAHEAARAAWRGSVIVESEDGAMRRYRDLDTNDTWTEPTS